jgi:hypothetical protein
VKNEIITIFNASKKENLPLVQKYGSSINEGPNEFAELMIGRLSLFSANKSNGHWRVAHACLDSSSASSCGFKAIDCRSEELLITIKTSIEQAFDDLNMHHEVWSNLGIV